MIKIETPSGYKIETSTKEDALALLRELEAVTVTIDMDVQNRIPTCPLCGCEDVEYTLQDDETPTYYCLNNNCQHVY